MPPVQGQVNTYPSNVAELSIPQLLSELEKLEKKQESHKTNEEAAAYHTFVDDGIDVSSFKHSDFGTNKKTHGVSASEMSFSERH